MKNGLMTNTSKAKKERKMKFLIAINLSSSPIAAQGAQSLGDIIQCQKVKLHSESSSVKECQWKKKNVQKR